MWGRMMICRNCFLYCFLVWSCLVVPTALFAQDAEDVHPFLIKKYIFNAGVYFPDRSFKVGIDASTPSPTPQFDVSEQFKLSESETTESFEFAWRFAERWVARGQYFSVGGSKSLTLDEDVEWGDYTFGAGTGISGGVDVSITRLFAGYSLRHDGVQEFGVGAGVHRLDLGVFISGQAIINNNPPESVERHASTVGPLPNLGGWYLRSLSKRWALFTRLDWLSASIDKYDGSILNAALGINFAVSPHFGIGASYNYFEIDLTINDTSWTGTAEQRIDGPFVYLTATW